MRIVNNCRDRALLLLQIAHECLEIEERATFLAQEWLVAADLRILSGLIDRTEQVRTH
jgi:hypothetical protein